ncbi:MAG: hypothetical protein KAY24_19430 [Candidatus Eisenbacteria sp.]|nr:hypothetical protein [Candidatus Eisenbacteria bacterium]
MPEKKLRHPVNSDCYEYALEVYRTDLRRFELNEQKALRFLTVLTLQLATLAFFGRWMLRELLPPGGDLSALLLLLALAQFACIIGAWIYILRLLKPSVRRTLALDERVLAAFAPDHESMTVRDIVDRLVEAHASNQRSAQTQVEALKGAHRAMRLACTF